MAERHLMLDHAIRALKGTESLASGAKVSSLLIRPGALPDPSGAVLGDPFARCDGE